MAEVIRMPRMSDTMEEGVIVGWQKKVGDQVEPGDVLAEVETDKATMELESFHEGVLLHIGVKEGPVAVNGVLAVIGEEGEDFKAALEAAEEEGSSSGEESKEEEDKSQKTESREAKKEEAVVTVEEKSAAASESSKSEGSDQRLKASPLARSMAAESGIDLSSVQGSGDNGRIVKRDIVARMNEQPSQAAAAPAPEAKKEAKKEATEIPEVPAFNYGGEDSYEDKTISQMRKTIARRLGESKFGAPHFYLTIEVDMSRTISTRKQINEMSETRISFNDIVVKACAAALKLHPAINSSWMGDKIRQHHAINIGVAVAVDEGLLVPVLRHVDMKSLSHINAETKALAAKARERKLQPDEMQGNTFTVSNLGMFGIEEFTAIINPPDACILAVGAIIEKPVVKDGEIVPGNMMKMTLSCDHRVVDGATGARFLQTLKEMLEEPIRLLV